MKVISFNVNGVRARLHQIEALIQQHQPDVIGIQEVKAQDSDFPYDAITTMGYHVETYGQKGHYGVALLSKNPPVKVERGYPFDDEEAQKRLITGHYKTDSGADYIVINGYFPQGDSQDHEWKYPYKKKFYADLNRWLEDSFNPEQNLMIIGDFNISETDYDIGIGEDNAKRWLRTGKCSFLPEEREWFEHLKSWGLTEAYRHLYPEDNNKFSWFDYRSKGFDREPKRGLRIDGLLLTNSLLGKLQNSEIDYGIRAVEKPSDHAPIWASFKL